jgi:hypothetical protein
MSKGSLQRKTMPEIVEGVQLLWYLNTSVKGIRPRRNSPVPSKPILPSPKSLTPH